VQSCATEPFLGAVVDIDVVVIGIERLLYKWLWEVVFTDLDPFLVLLYVVFGLVWPVNNAVFIHGDFMLLHDTVYCPSIEQN
jgi:hypothetical protein